MPNVAQLELTGGPFYPGFDYRPARRPHTYDLFLSSSNEVTAVRDQVEQLADQAFAKALGAYANADLSVIRWEQAISGQMPGESLNDLFVRMALNCHHTLVLLMTHLGPGTREEVEAVVEKGLPISIIRFDPPRNHSSEYDPGEVDAFIAGLPRRIKYESCGPPTSASAWRAMSKTLAAITLGMYRKYIEETTEDLRELRG
jgi:hypothetical protein